MSPGSWRTGEGISISAGCGAMSRRGWLGWPGTHRTISCLFTDNVLIIIRETGVTDNNITRMETQVRRGELSPGAAADSVIEMMMNRVQSGKLS